MDGELEIALIDLASVELINTGEESCSPCGCVVARLTGTESAYPNLNQAAYVIGWAALDRRVSFKPDSFVLMPEEHSGDMLHRLTWSILLRIIQVVRKAPIAPGETVCVLGSGFLARQIVRFLQEHTWASHVFQNQTIYDPPAQSVDILIDTVGDQRLLAKALACIRPRGRVILLAPHDFPSRFFNFYPEIHRHSLTLLTARGVFQPKDPEQAISTRRFLALLDYYSKTPWFLECEDGLRNLLKITLTEMVHQPVLLPLEDLIVSCSVSG